MNLGESYNTLGGVCVCSHTCNRACVEVRRQHVGVVSLLPCRPWGSNAGHQPWQPSPLPTEPSLHPDNELLTGKSRFCSRPACVMFMYAQPTGVCVHVLCIMMDSV